MVHCLVGGTEVNHAAFRAGLGVIALTFRAYLTDWEDRCVVAFESTHGLSSKVHSGFFEEWQSQ